MTEFVLTVLVWAVPVLLAITLHEAAHGYAAWRLGDPTAYMLGRVSLNPLRHIDPVGTIAVPLALLLLGAVAGGGMPIFGWAKPVPVRFGKLRRPKQDMFWVAVAGPATNFVQAFAWGLVLGVQDLLGGFGGPLFYQMGQAGIAINISLMLLNLLPIPPLDGGRIAVSLLPMPWAATVARIEPYGFMILMMLLYTRVLDRVLGPLTLLLRQFVAMVTGA